MAFATVVDDNVEQRPVKRGTPASEEGYLNCGQQLL